MKSAHFLTVAVGMVACTHSGNTCAVNFKNSTTGANIVKNTSAIPVVRSTKPVVNAVPELPFFKDVPNSKRLFW